MEQWNNMIDIEEDDDVSIVVDTDFPDNLNTFIYAHVTDGADLYIEIATNKKFKIDIYLSDGVYTFVHKSNLSDIHFFKSDNNTNPESSVAENGNYTVMEKYEQNQNEGYVTAKINIITEKNNFYSQFESWINSKVKNKSQQIPVQISAHIINRNNMCIKVYNPSAFNIYAQKERLPLKDMMTDREYRKAATIQKNNLYKFQEFDNLWPVLSILKTDYILALAELSKERYSLYNIICFIYIKNHLDNPHLGKVRLNKTDLLNRKNTSLNSLVSLISQTYAKEKEKIPDENINDDEEYDEKDSTMNHFKGFHVTCIRRLNKFFNFIFESESGFDQLHKDSKFNLCDYGFISYLLSNEAYYDLDSFIKEHFEEVHHCFYHRIYVGLKSMSITHNISLQEKNLDIIFKERFKYDLNR